MKSVSLAAALAMASLSSPAFAKGGVGEIFGALIGKVVGNSASRAAVDTPTVEGALSKMADQVNRQLPMAVDRDTRWENIAPGPGRRFTYNYTYITATTREIDKPYFLQVMQPKLRNIVCSSPEMQVFFKNGITVGYAYRASDGIFIIKIEITPKDCGYAI